MDKGKLYFFLFGSDSFFKLNYWAVHVNGNNNQWVSCDGLIYSPLEEPQVGLIGQIDGTRAN